MRLQTVGLRGRRFFIQFSEIMCEFGREIPWLDGMDEMRFATNGEWFRDELLRRLVQHDGVITPYQFVDADARRTYVGGILHFNKSPERLRDAHNAATAERLSADGASFISCLQVREARRGFGAGTAMTARAIGAIQEVHGAVWGVASDRSLLPWYESLGAQVLSPADNRDKLWIVHWPSPTTQS